MTEEEARDWLRKRFGVPRETELTRFSALLVDEATRQNLISAATIPTLWSRHLVDSAQLIEHAEGHAGTWLDIGSGAGLPGLVVAVLTDRQVTLVEPRKRRAEFLTRCAEALGVADRVRIEARSVQQIDHEPAAVISARAVAPLAALLEMAHRHTSKTTLWILPKGRSVESEVAAARETWHGRFDLMPSVTDPDARIVLIRRAAPR